MTPAGADWLASASAFPRSVHALWAARPTAPSVLPCGIAFDVVSAPALFGRRMVDRLWGEGPGSGPVAVQRGRVLLFTRPGVAQRLPSLLSWEEWGAGVVPPLLCHGAGDAVTIPPLRAPEPAGFGDLPEAADPFAGPFAGPFLARRPGAEGGPYREGAYEEAAYAAGGYGAREVGSYAGAADPDAGALASVASAAAGGADAGRRAAGAGGGSRWLVAPDVRHPWLPGPDVLLWACVRAARGQARGARADTPVTRASPSGRG
ncbi:bifunctional DNA primase/polymerase [Streptomyces buecherae]|uniref:bifunctional DNA primase/polymerase n=1 Tax=Streptomyces buecherae TaxID=2763006 RepID=UPI00379F7061